MKKLVLLISILTISGIANAYPAPDMTEGGSPFLLIQQKEFERTELNDYENRKENMKFLRRIKKPTRVDLQKPSHSEFERPVEPSEMQLQEENGKILIKQAQ